MTPVKNTKQQKTLAILIAMGKAEQLIIKRLVNTAWHIAYTALWNNMQFTCRQKQKARNQIAQIITAAQQPEKNFEELVAAVINLKKQLTCSGGKVNQQPVNWFDRQNKTGYCTAVNNYYQLHPCQAAYLNEYKQLGWVLFQAYGKYAARDLQKWSVHYKGVNTELYLFYLQVLANQCHWLRGGVTGTLQQSCATA